MILGSSNQRRNILEETYIHTYIHTSIHTYLITSTYLHTYIPTSLSGYLLTSSQKKSQTARGVTLRQCFSINTSLLACECMYVRIFKGNDGRIGRMMMMMRMIMGEGKGGRMKIYIMRTVERADIALVSSSYSSIALMRYLYEESISIIIMHHLCIIHT